MRRLSTLVLMWTLTLRGGASSLLSSLVRLGPSVASAPAIPVMRLPLELTPKLVNDEASLREMQSDLRELVSQPLLLPPLLPSASPFPWEERGTLPLVNVVGIDCEWRPENYYSKAAESNNLLRPWLRVRKSLSRFWSKLQLRSRPVSPPKSKTAASSVASPVQLLQISSRRSVWVLDLQALCRRPHSFASSATTATTTATALTENEQLLNSMLASVLHAENVIKVGMGPAQDLKRLGWSYPWLSATLSHRAVLDVQTLAKRANPGVAARDLEGLNKLCVRELGEGVDKSLQCSDWAQRPLSLPQLAYAGLDAVALIRLFDVLLSKAVDVLGSDEVPAVSGKAQKKSKQGAAALPAAQAPAQLQILAPLLFEYHLAMPPPPPPAPEQQGEVLAPVPLRSMGATQSSMRGWLTRSVDAYAS